MPVMVFYKEKSLPLAVAQAVVDVLAEATQSMLNAKMEARVVEPVLTYNANEIHIEMRFRDFKEWTDQQIAEYHEAVMTKIGQTLVDHKVNCAYSFYIVPSQPPRSMWAQNKV